MDPILEFVRCRLARAGSGAGGRVAPAGQKCHLQTCGRGGTGEEARPGPPGGCFHGSAPSPRQSPPSPLPSATGRAPGTRGPHLHSTDEETEAQEGQARAEGRGAMGGGIGAPRQAPPSGRSNPPGRRSKGRDAEEPPPASAVLAAWSREGAWPVKVTQPWEEEAPPRPAHLRAPWTGVLGGPRAHLAHPPPRGASPRRGRSRAAPPHTGAARARCIPAPAPPRPPGIRIRPGRGGAALLKGTCLSRPLGPEAARPPPPSWVSRGGVRTLLVVLPPRQWPSRKR